MTENEAYVYPLSPLVYNETRIFNGKRLYRKIHTLRIGVYPFVMYLSKHSCFTPAINDKIQYVLASGLIEKWTAEYKETRFSKSQRRHDENVPRTINITQLIGVFQLYGFFLIVASISFILEIVIA